MIANWALVVAAVLQLAAIIYYAGRFAERIDGVRQEIGGVRHDIDGLRDEMKDLGQRVSRLEGMNTRL